MDSIYKFMMAMGGGTTPESGAYANDEAQLAAMGSADMMKLGGMQADMRQQQASQFNSAQTARGVSQSNPAGAQLPNLTPNQGQQGDQTTGDMAMLNIMQKAQEAQAKRFDTLRKADAANQAKIQQEKLRGMMMLANTGLKNEGALDRVNAAGKAKKEAAEILANNKKMNQLAGFARNDADRRNRLFNYLTNQKIKVPDGMGGEKDVPFGDILSDPGNQDPDVMERAAKRLSMLSDNFIDNGGFDTKGVDIKAYREIVGRNTGFQKLLANEEFQKWPYDRKMAFMSHPNTMSMLGLTDPNAINLPLLMVLGANDKSGVARGRALMEYIYNRPVAEAPAIPGQNPLNAVPGQDPTADIIRILAEGFKQ